jgi:hypothetical protein
MLITIIFAPHVTVIGSLLKERKVVHTLTIKDFIFKNFFPMNFIHFHTYSFRKASVGDLRGIMVLFPVEVGELSVPQNVQTGSGAHLYH